jgi:hypothetical protein
MLKDTSPEAERVLIGVYRKMSPGQKWLRLGETFRAARILHAAGVRLRHPGATPTEIHRDWMKRHFNLPESVLLREPSMDQNLNNLGDLRAAIAILDRLGIPYAVGGSMASSVHGILRFTEDADVTVEPFPGKETQLAAAFGPGYYISLEAVQDAVRRRSSFNVICLDTGFKIDIFVRKDQPFEEMAMSRRELIEFPDIPGKPLFFHSAEDTILFKLTWYRLGNESSDRQWSDILNMLKVQADRLDSAYLDHWAAVLKVDDLLARARQAFGS